MNDDSASDQTPPDELRPLLNTFSPRAERQILTEGYQPSGSDKVPDLVPPLVSGVYFPKPSPNPFALNEPPAGGLKQTVDSPGKK